MDRTLVCMWGKNAKNLQLKQPADVNTLHCWYLCWCCSTDSVTNVSILFCTCCLREQVLVEEKAQRPGAGGNGIRHNFSSSHQTLMFYSSLTIPNLQNLPRACRRNPFFHPLLDKSSNQHSVFVPPGKSLQLMMTVWVLENLSALLCYKGYFRIKWNTPSTPVFVDTNYTLLSIPISLWSESLG